ncbi:retrovirus-related pol polyprotein from transposon TNT 1-94 [Tanacetum coccineum]
MAIPVTNDPSNTNPNNNINDPLHLASSDHPGMVLTNTPFNRGNFLGWSRNVKMALGAKLKLGFIDGSCLKPSITDDNVQRWVRCDYMLSEAFLYAQSAYELWKEIAERYGQSNGPLIYQLKRELSKITQGNLSIAAFFNKLKRCWDELQNLNGLPVSNCGKMQECTCAIYDKFLERDSHLNFGIRIGYPDWYKGKKAKKNARIVAHVNSGFEEMISGDTPFDLSFENDIGMGQNGSVDQRLVAVVCSEMMKMFKGKRIVDDNNGAIRNYASTSTHAGASDHMTPHFSLFITTRYLSDPIMVHLPYGRSLKVTIVGEDLTTEEIVAVGKGSRCLYICKPMLDPTSFAASIEEFHKLGHTSVSKLVHIPDCKQFDVSNFHYESCMISKHHRLPFPISNSIQNVSFALLHMDLWGPYKQSALNGAHYFFTIVDDKTRATWTYLVHSKDQIPVLLTTFLAYVENHFAAKPRFIRTDNGIEVLNKTCVALFNSKGIVHQKLMVYTPQQNGVVERKHRHLLETARSLRVHANLPMKFWGECILAATYLINKMPMKKLQWKSPFEVLFGKQPEYSHLRTIGCLCYAAVVKLHKDKFENRGIKYVLIGYPSHQKGYQLYNLETKEVFSSRDVVFQEDVFPFKESTETVPNLSMCQFPIFCDPEPSEQPMNSFTQPTQLNPNTPFVSSDDQSNSPIGSANVQQTTHPIVPPIPPITSRKSTRNSAKPAWLKDFVTPKSTNGTAAFCSAQP